MMRWIVVLTGIALAMVAALGLLVVSAWTLDTLLRPVLTSKQIDDVGNTVSAGAIVGIIVVGITGAAAIIVRTDVWTPLARALALWDFVFALAFAWTLVRPLVPALEGPWKQMILTVLLMGIAARRVWVILRVDALGIPAVIKLAEETKQSAGKTERLAQQTLDASAIDTSNPDKLNMARSVGGENQPDDQESDN